MRVVICGAGIAGLTLAHRLAAADWEVLLVEQAPGPRQQGYMIDFFGPGYDVAERMGLLPRLRELGYVVEEAAWLDGDGRVRARLEYARVERATGGRVMSLMRPDLERALREHLPATVEVRYATSVRAVDDGADGVRVGLTDGSRVDADLLAGADGIHSVVRRLVFGAEERFVRCLGFHTAAWVFHDPDVRAKVGPRFCLTDSTGRQLGLYALRDGKVAVFAVHRSPDPALPADPRAALRAEYGSLGWVAPRVLEQAPEPAHIYYDQVAQTVLPRWSRGRVALVGDACGAVSLLAGQGASLGMAGAYVLADNLGAARTVAAGLAAYERAWRPLTEDKQRSARRLARWFLPRTRAELVVRRAGLRLLALPGTDRLLAGTLTGKPAPVPSAAVPYDLGAGEAAGAQAGS
ncbi:FAD-dependent oxidoreductase [Actinopolymorpha sp. NPDC004070]|uniref:FAD-dependent oxidoreductase n=1 Tax=Actinopolymorpha sp. NPDC004070 TaxID=3154548 RepID=UPI0033B68C0E